MIMGGAIIIESFQYHKKAAEEKNGGTACNHGEGACSTVYPALEESFGAFREVWKGTKIGGMSPQLKSKFIQTSMPKNV